MDARGERALPQPDRWPFYGKRLCVVLYLLALAFIVLCQSPLRFWDSGLPGTDSSVFQTVAMMMRRGFMPYRDSFDHKGPLIYAINYLGSLLSSRWGIWLVELVSLLATFVAMYRIARLWCGRVGSCVAVSAAAMPLLSSGLNFFEGGNLVEEYAMPFIAVALYIFLDYLDSEHVTRLRLAVCGLCLGGVCLLRVNMIAVWIVFCLAIAGRCAVRKEFAQLGTFILFFLAGFAAAVLPFLIWLAANGALLPFLQDYILFNTAYAAGSEGGSATMLSTLQSYLKPEVLVLVAVYAYAALTAKAKERLLYWAYLASLALSLVLVCLSRYNFPHYGMVLVPLLVVPVAAVCRRAAERLEETNGALLPRALTAAAAVVLISCYSQTAHDTLNTAVSYQDQGLVEAVCAVVEGSTGADDSISVFGNWDIIYLESGRPHATTYSYQSPVCSVDPKMMEEYLAQLAQEEPKLIVFPRDVFSKMPAVMEPFLREHGYAVIWTEGYLGGAEVYARS